ncbi:disintegrin and metalloproteinase domain-containing protein 10 [Plectropomus leopardus]|uniref:disintegrin and metalloproteinase domain-containing protein 10 n=1 Tax=Plectropomus leopardus TaxID=160734 RepID=UPI001C4BC183|nr:disintegrin and metalloproteinase domain-containing protein 10 [Plectropomus leopardus]
MGVQHYWLLLLLVDSLWRITGAVSDISPYIKRYESLSYDREDLHRKHLRARRASQPQEYTLHLDLTAFNRTFHLRLKHDASVFSKNFVLVSENGSTSADLSHIYSGTLDGEHGSVCHGSVLQGQFEGTIHTDNGTYHIEPVNRYTSNQTDHHSIIYNEDDIVLPSKRTGSDGFCAAQHLNLRAQSLSPDEKAPVSRGKRTVDESKTSCLLHIHADHYYYKKFKSVAAVIAQIHSYMRAVNDIYDKVDFDGIKLINFKVKSLQVMTEDEKNNPLNPLYIGPEKLLRLYAESNWNDFCLAYVLTDRDYSGTLGLAFEGKPGNAGGICSKQINLQKGGTITKNTGLVTIQNYGHYIPAPQVQLTFAHELGHSLGSPHDDGSNCGNLGSRGGKGRYLMYPEATGDLRENNDKFSPCSIEHISRILKLKKDDCFVVSDQPICGNLIVEDGEECDVGQNDSDLCCFSAKQAAGLQCRLKPGKVCSPSQGLCCAQDCGFKPVGQSCDEETDCQKEAVCSGLSPFCPQPSAKENLTVCSQGTRVCLNGACVESVCMKHSLQQCDCPGDSMKEKCHMCCQQPDKPETCASTTSSVLSHFFQKKVLPLVGGAPCSGNRGYCDKFQVCRLLDADGPIARLKNSFLNLDDYDDIAEWMKVYWWAILLAILTLSAVMGCTICLCGRKLETDEFE